MNNIFFYTLGCWLFNPDLSVYPRFYSPSRLVSYKQPSRRLRGGVELTDFVTTKSWKQPKKPGDEGKVGTEFGIMKIFVGFSTSCLQNSLNPFASGRLSCIKFQEWNVRNLVKLRPLPIRYFGHFSWRAFEKACMVRNTKKNPRGIFPSKEDLGFWGSFYRFQMVHGTEMFTYIDTINF